MAEVNASDVLRLLANFEPSRAKLWEIARSYDRYSLARVLYTMENVSLDSRRALLSIERYNRACFCECRCALLPGTLPGYDEYDCGGDVDYVLATTMDATLRLTRATYRYDPNRLWLTGRGGECVPSRNVSAWTCPECGRHSRTPPPESLYANRIPADDNDNDDAVAAAADDDRPAKRIKLDGSTLPDRGDDRENDSPTTNNNDDDADDADDGGTVLDFSDDRDISFEATLNNIQRQQGGVRGGAPAAAASVDAGIPLQGLIVAHNMGTRPYQQFRSNVTHLLLSPNDHSDRNETTNRTNVSLVTKFLRFHDALRYGLAVNSDPRYFRNMPLPSAGRFFCRELSDLEEALRRYVHDDCDEGRAPTSAAQERAPPNVGPGRTPLPADADVRPKRPAPALANYCVQPLYQGLHVVVYTSATEMRCYNRYGELCPNLAYQGARTELPCSFEAVLLPVDERNNVRSWRYWPFKSGWVLYVVDVLRYGESILTHLPYGERAQYIARIVDGDRLLAVPAALTEWEAIERLHESRRDVYDPIVGVMLRDPGAALSPPRTRPAAFHFPIRFAYDLVEGRIRDMDGTAAVQAVNLRQLHVCYEMADYKTIATVYTHCQDYLYFCRYNRALGQYVHAARMPRLLADDAQLQYRFENVFVLHARAVPRGLLYLRLYYDRSGTVIGYECKNSDGRFKVPLAFDPLLMDRATATRYEPTAATDDDGCPMILEPTTTPTTPTTITTTTTSVI